MRGLIAALIVVAGASIAAYFLLSGGDRPQKTPEKPKPRRIAEAKPAVSAVKTNETAKAPEKPKSLKERYRDMWGDKPMNAARLAAVSGIKEGIRFRSFKGTNATYETRLIRYKDNRLHQELVKYVHPGQHCDTPDPFSDKAALELADKAMQYGFDEPMEVLEERQAVEKLAKEMKQYIQDGGHANDYLMKLMQRQDEESEMMRTVRDNIRELCKEGDEKLANEALQKYNEHLRKNGLPSVKLDVKMQHYLKKAKEAQQ